MLKFSEELFFQKHFNQLKWRNRVNFLHFTCSTLDQSHYDVLNVSRAATQSEIKESYLKLCRLYHPDTSSDSSLSKDEKVKKFQRINEAYQCLSKAQSKIAYDNDGHSFHPGFTNPYTDRTRTYPRRPDGYRPYEEYGYHNAFRQRNQYSNHRRYDNPDNTYDRFRQQYDDAMRMRRAKNPNPNDMKAFRILVFASMGIVLYIVGIRLYILATYRQRKDVEKYGIPNFADSPAPSYDTRYDNIPYRHGGGLRTNRRQPDVNATDSKTEIHRTNEEENLKYTGYKFTKGEKYNGPENQFDMNTSFSNFSTRVP